MKKTIAALSLSFLFLFLMQNGVFAKNGAIRIALWKLPLNIPAMAAIEEKTYDKAFSGDREVEYVQLPSGPRQIQAMAAGALDISEGLGAPAVLVGAANGVDLKIVGVTSRSPKAFAVMVLDPSIKTAADLKGKKVAGLRGSVVHQLFLSCLKEAGMRESDVEFFPMALNAAASALIGGHVDAALLVGMEVIKAEQAGARVLVDGEGRLDGLSLIVARGAFLEQNPQAVKTYLDARRTITARLEKDPGSFLPLVAKETGLPAIDAGKTMKLYDFGDKITENDILELQHTVTYLQQGNYIRDDVDVASLIAFVARN